MNRQNSLPAFPADRQNGPMQPLPSNHLQASPPRVAPIIRWCFLAFVVSIVFENIDFFGISEFFAISKAFGFLLAGLALLQPTVCFARPPKAFWCFLAYVGVYSLRAAFVSDVGQPALSSIFTYTQLLLLFWISCNILQYGRAGKAMCIALVVSNVAVAILSSLGIATTESMEGRGIRESMCGANENELAFQYAVGVLSAVALAFFGCWLLWPGN